MRAPLGLLSLVGNNTAMNTSKSYFSRWAMVLAGGILVAGCVTPQSTNDGGSDARVSSDVAMDTRVATDVATQDATPDMPEVATPDSAADVSTRDIVLQFNDAGCLDGIGA